MIKECEMKRKYDYQSKQRKGNKNYHPDSRKRTRLFKMNKFLVSRSIRRSAGFSSYQRAEHQGVNIADSEGDKL